MLQRVFGLNEQLADFHDPPDGVQPALCCLSLAIAFRSLSYSAALKGADTNRNIHCDLCAIPGNLHPIPVMGSLDPRAEFKEAAKDKNSAHEATYNVNNEVSGPRKIEGERTEKRTENH